MVNVLPSVPRGTVNRGPLVSICIPTRNRAPWLRESLKSIRGQDYAPLEILISDNASDDDTEAVCREASRADGRIRYVRHAQNLGLYGNHNFCVDASRGEFLCLFHDHDERDTAIVSTFVEFLLRHPRVGVVCSDWDLIDHEGRVLGLRDHHVAEVTPGMDYIGQTIRSGRSAIGVPGAMVRRAALGDIRFDEHAPIGFGDFVVWCRVAEQWEIGHVSRRLWSWRQDRRSESARTIESMTVDYYQNLTTYCDGHLARWPEHAALVEEWKRAIHRYLFWALVFEVGLHFRRRRPQVGEDGGTLFEIMDYRLTPEQFQRALEQLAVHQQGTVERTTRLLVTALVRARVTWPLAWATEHHASLGALLGLR